MKENRKSKFRKHIKTHIYLKSDGCALSCIELSCVYRLFILAGNVFTRTSPIHLDSLYSEHQNHFIFPYSIHFLIEKLRQLFSQ